MNKIQVTKGDSIEWVGFDDDDPVDKVVEDEDLPGHPTGHKVFVQVADDMGKSEPNVIEAVAPDTSPQVAAMTYLICGTAPSTTYFGQVSAPALWLNRNASGRFDPHSLETLSKISRGEQATATYFRTSQAYVISLVAEKTGRRITAPMTRPRAGMHWRVAEPAEVVEYVRLPAAGHSIGEIAGIANTVAVRLNAELLRHHIISAGSTGSGKTNTNVHILHAAQNEGWCSLIYDAKPDYSEIDLANDETVEPPVITAGLKNARFWSLGTKPTAKETAISVRACDLDPAKLANAVFYRPAEDLQSETAEHLLTGYADNQIIAANPNWTIWDFVNWLNAQKTAAEAAAAMPFPTAFNDRTFQAIRQKLNRPGRIPNWIDVGTQNFRPGQPFGGAFGGSRGVVPGDDEAEPIGASVAAGGFLAGMKPGEINIIRVPPEGGGRSYALFLDYAMRQVASLRKRSAIPPVLHLVDEAADIFSSSNKRLREAMTSTLDEQIRKGRSLSVGFCLSAQSAGDIPEQIRHNLNSSIIFRHKQPKVLKEILPDVSDAIYSAASRLQSGEAIVQLFKTYGLLRCRMWQSPARLFKPGN